MKTKYSKTLLCLLLSAAFQYSSHVLADTINLSLDNDFLASNEDYDYTGGVSIGYLKPDISHHSLSPGGILKGLNKILHIPGADSGTFHLQNYELGLVTFTPKNREARLPLPDDRPYSNLLYFSSGQKMLHLEKNRTWSTSLSAGVFGTTIGSEIQNTIHDWTGDNDVKGWQNQISNGGEPTLMYEVARQQLHPMETKYFQFSTIATGSVGYLTEFSYGGTMRSGILDNPWWSLNSNPANIGSQLDPSHVGNKPGDDFYFILGAKAKARLYNAHIQGQFKDSVVTYSFSEIHHFLFEGWIGVTKGFASTVQLSYIFRFHTSEIKKGMADRSFRWGSLLLSFSI